MTDRNKFIQDLFNFLHEHDKDYVVLKYIEESIASIGEYSDIDLAVKKDLSGQIMNYLDQYENILYYKAYSYSFMEMTYIVFEDKTFIELDLINNFIRKDISYLDIDEIIDNVYINHEGIKISIPEYNFLNIFLFYLLNKTNIATKYKNYFISLPNTERKNILDFINKRYSLNVPNLIDLCIYNNHTYQRVYKSISYANGILLKIKNIMLYPKNMYVNITKSKIITFSSVPGNEKTIALSEFIEILEKKYRRNVVKIRYRPSILTIISVIKHNLHGDIIIYNQDYFDFIHDNNFAQFFYKFVFKPKMNIFLFAPPEVILSRKHKIEEESIMDLIKNYKSLFDKFSQKEKEQYVSIENVDKEDTMTIIEDIYIKTSL